jgi:assimilatory nitrate reductase catalytic subunit
MSSPSLKKSSALRRWEGPLTADLTQRPGDFGLGQVPARLKPDGTANIVCGFCSTGCGLNVHLKDGQAVNLSPTTDYPVNLGMACPKGWEALTPLASPDRALTPLLRNAHGKMEPVSWDTAVTAFARRFKEIQARHGPDALAWIGTGQIVTEELAFLGALAKFGLGIRHGDGNTRQCMATSAVAYKQSFGFDAPPFTYADFEESDVIVLVGSNLCIAHPIMWQRVLRNKNRPQIIVIDPRKTETAMAATHHLAIQPKSDLKLLYGIAHLLIEHGWINPEFIANHTSGFSEFQVFVKAFTPEVVAEASGLSIQQLQDLAAAIHRGRRVSFWWTMGVNQGHEATRTAQAIINLALMTGNIGRPGTGANSITGQCNAMGSRLFSNTTNLLGGHDFLDAGHRARVARILGLDEGRVPAQNSWAYDQIIQGIADDRIKGLWIVGTNTSHSWIDQSAFNELAKKLEFLVVQDMYATTETAQRAHLVLPAAGWGEKDGTFINSERRIGLVKRIARAPGQVLSDFNIFKLVAHYWGCADLFARWSSPEAVFQIMKQLSRGQPCDITGIRDYRMIDDCGGIQWPWPEVVVESLNRLTFESEPAATIQRFNDSTIQRFNPSTSSPPGRERRLFADGRFFHPDGKAKLIFESPRAMAEPTDADYPFLLLTGRGTSAQWHTGTRTDKSAVLRTLYPANIYVEINPLDASRLRLAPNDLVRVASRRGKIKARAFITSTVQPGQVFIPMHYAATNQLTHPAFDPYSRQPSYKACAVMVTRARPGHARSGVLKKISSPRPTTHA